MKKDPLSEDIMRPRLKPSEFLRNFGSHEILGSDELKKIFKSETGLEPPPWKEYTEDEQRQIIDARGCGGHVAASYPGELLCVGYQVAEAVAALLLPGYVVTKRGRGFRYTEAVETLEKYGH
jgi:hypothetical protein